MHLLAGGGFSLCALQRDGTVRCWGNSTSGELGNLDAGETSTVAVPVLRTAVEP